MGPCVPPTGGAWDRGRIAPCEAATLEPISTGAGESELVVGDGAAGVADDGLLAAPPATSGGVEADAMACGVSGTALDEGEYGVASTIKLPKSFDPILVPRSAGVDDTSIHALATVG
jgi:hypothetical protein